MRFSVSENIQDDWKILRLEDSLEGSFAEIVPEAGAILNAFGVQTGSGSINIVHGYKNKADWQAQSSTTFQSAKLNPFVCRIDKASYPWNNQIFHLKKYKHEAFALHGLISQEKFMVADMTASPEYAEITLSFKYEGDDPGYPFSFDCFVRYRLEANGKLLAQTAIHNRSNITIPLADGWHVYFHLGDSVNTNSLMINATRQFQYDDNLVPTGIIVEDGRWQQEKIIEDASLDNCYILNNDGQGPACSLRNPENGLSVTIRTDPSYPFLQVYIPQSRKSISLEPLSAPPDTFNNKIGLISLAPDHTSTFGVTYQVSKE